ncbi:MAG: PfkB family carbohydrate kinase, partial [Planctomycetes bacterium]|nr:PfkB family carbohydrate kinase [Planctomycetota bacterium]
RDGCGMLHLSGLFAALGPETGRCCLAAAEAAKAGGALVSFDLNHRASFWRGREKELEDIFRRIAGLSDILIGNEEDYQLALNLHGPEAGGNDLAGQLDSFKTMIERARSEFPSVSVFATTMREVVDANTHHWGAVLSANGEWHIEPPRPISVLDRIGGGDSFVGGLLYGILKGWKPESWLHFGWACGALAVTMLYDFACPADEDQVWSVYHGNARVQR